MRWRIFCITLILLALGSYLVDIAATARARTRAQGLIRQLITDDPVLRRGASDSLGEMGPAAAPAVIDVLRHGGVLERRAGVRASERVVERCLSNFETMNCVTGYVPGRGAAERAFDEVCGALTDSLADVDMQVRREAARVILLGSEFAPERRQRAVDVLREAIRDSDPASRRSLVERVCRPGRYGGLPPDAGVAARILDESLNDGDAAVRLAAVEALDRSEHVNSVPLIVKALRDPDESVRRAAERACLAGNYLPRFISAPNKQFASEVEAAFRSDIPFFVECLRHGDPTLGVSDRPESRLRAIVALKWAGGTEAIPHLIEALGDSSHDGDGTLKWAIVRSLNALSEDADCLAVLGRYVAELKAVSSGPFDREVRSAAESILRRMNH